MRKLNFLVLVLTMSILSLPVHAQVQFLQETFGTAGFYDGASKDYGDFSSDLIFSTDTFRIQGWNASNGYDIASGSSHTIMSTIDGFNRDTLTFKYDLAATGFSNIQYGMGVFSYGNAANDLTAEYSIDSATWTVFDNTSLADGSFGDNGSWGHVTFSELLPNSGMIYIRLISSGQLHYDDLILIGDPPADQNPFLSELNLSEGALDPTFAYNVYSYTVTLPYGTTSAPTVTPVPDIAEATMVETQVADITSATDADRTYTVEVTATDGTTKATYSILFNVMPPATDASLSNLAVEGYMLAPGFNPDMMQYIVYVPDTLTSIPQVTAFLSDENATVDIAPAMDLTQDADTTVITVTAEDATTTKEYHIIFNPGYESEILVGLERETFGSVGFFRGLANTYENYVSDLSFGSDTIRFQSWNASDYEGASGNAHGIMEVAADEDTLAFSASSFPGFQNIKFGLGYFAYFAPTDNADFEYSADSVTWTKFDETSLLMGNFGANGEWGFITFSETLPDNPHFRIVALNDQVHVDDLTFFGTPLSPEARLADIAVAEGSIAPSFDPMLKNYVVKIPAGTTETPVINAEAWDPNATVTITDATDVTAQAESARTSIIEVTAADGMHMMTYNVIFTFESVSLTSVTLFREEFGANGFYIGEALNYPDYTSLAPDNLMEGDSAYIRNNDESSTGYDGASGDAFLLLQPANSWVALNDTFTMKGINIPDAFKDIRISFGTTANTGWPGYRDHNFAMDYSTDGENWTALKGPGIETLGNDTFPNNDWAWVRLAEDIPVSDNLHVRFYNDEANHQYYIDDFTISGVPLGNEATLAEITVSDGALDPAFDPATMQYTVLLPYGTTDVPTVDVTEVDTNATNTIDPAVDLTSADVADRTATITVVAENEMDTEVYTVLFEVEPNDDATLSDLTLSEGTLDPAFSAVTFNYSADLPAGTTTAPAITATPTDPNATVDVTDATNVTSTSAADRTSTIVVTAEDGETMLTYTVVFEVLVGIYDQYLNNLSIFPNPAHDVMEIQNVANFTRIEMTNLTGQRMQVLENEGADRIEMNVSTLDAGVYILHFYVNDKYAGAKQVMKK